MVKRFLKGIVAAVAALSMTVSVMAAGSIVGAIDKPKVSSSEGTAVLSEVTEGMYDAALYRMVRSLNGAPRTATVAEAFGDDLVAVNLYNADGLKTRNIDLSQYKFLSSVMDLKIEGATPTEKNPVKVTFVVNNMTDYIIVDVLHYCEEHGWEILEGVKISNNQLEVYFHSNPSAVAIIYRDKEGVTVDTDAKAPQTGERSALPYGMGIVVLCGLGVFAVKKSRKAA